MCGVFCVRAVVRQFFFFLAVSCSIGIVAQALCVPARAVWEPSKICA